jgi:hypothetical protein
VHLIDFNHGPKISLLVISTMASTPISLSSDGIISLSHISSSTSVHLEQPDDSIEYMMATPQTSIRKGQIVRQRAPLACIAVGSAPAVANIYEEKNVF